MNLPDFIGLCYREVFAQSPVAILSAFGAGIVTSLGPCVAPRYLTLAMLVSGAERRARWMLLASFVAGLVASYLALGVVASVLATVARFSAWTYGVLAVVLAISGIASLVVRSEDACCRREAPAVRSYGGSFLLGASSALVLSPCCTPFIAAIGGLAALQHGVALTIGVIAAYACGHAFPLTFVLMGSAAASRLVRGATGARAVSAVSGGLALALACYYGILA